MNMKVRKRSNIIYNNTVAVLLPSQKSGDNDGWRYFIVWNRALYFPIVFPDPPFACWTILSTCSATIDRTIEGK